MYEAVVQPSLLYGAETWTTTKEISRRLEANEMRMLRWSGVTLHDKIWNELIRGTFGVKDPAWSKVVERRLNWYGQEGKERREAPIAESEGF